MNAPPMGGNTQSGGSFGVKVGGRSGSHDSPTGLHNSDNASSGQPSRFVGRGVARSWNQTKSAFWYSRPRKKRMGSLTRLFESPKPATPVRPELNTIGK